MINLGGLYTSKVRPHAKDKSLLRLVRPSPAFDKCFYMAFIMSREWVWREAVVSNQKNQEQQSGDPWTMPKEAFGRPPLRPSAVFRIGMSNTLQFSLGLCGPQQYKKNIEILKIFKDIQYVQEKKLTYTFKS